MKTSLFILTDEIVRLKMCSKNKSMKIKTVYSMDQVRDPSPFPKYIV